MAWRRCTHAHTCRVAGAAAYPHGEGAVGVEWLLLLDVVERHGAEAAGVLDAELLQQRLAHQQLRQRVALVQQHLAHRLLLAQRPGHSKHNARHSMCVCVNRFGCYKVRVCLHRWNKRS